MISIGDTVIARLRNDGLSLRISTRGTLIVTPKASLTSELRELIKANQSEILEALARWPNNEAKARSYAVMFEPATRDERARPVEKFPRVLLHLGRRGGGPDEAHPFIRRFILARKIMIRMLMPLLYKGRIGASMACFEAFVKACQFVAAGRWFSVCSARRRPMIVLAAEIFFRPASDPLRGDSACAAPRGAASFSLA